ncbi:MAG: hypothetical protein PSN37_06210 [Alphaproteobacteria bacterium]|nr:hypothetical protein [Alphaproteobacteria bacterium]
MQINDIKEPSFVQYKNTEKINETVSRDELLPYISSMLTEMHNLAKATDLSALVYFMQMALDEIDLQLGLQKKRGS